MNELLSEIKYVSNFYDSYLVSYGFGFSSGVFKAIGGMFEALFHIIFHPIDTLTGIYHSIKSIPDGLIKVKNDPATIIKEPIYDAKKYLDDIETDIAMKNNLDLDRLVLSETTDALRHERNILAAGEKGTDIGIAVLPFIGGFGKTAKAAKLAEATKAAKVAEVGAVPIAGDISKTVTAAQATKMTTLAKVEGNVAKTGYGADKLATDKVVKSVENMDAKTSARSVGKIEKSPRIDGKISGEQEFAKLNVNNRNQAVGKTKLIEGKDIFYPKVSKSITDAGYDYHHDIKGKGKSHANKPDFIAVKGNEILYGEIKSGKELSSTSSWRNAPKRERSNIEKKKFTEVRDEIRKRADLIDEEIKKLRKEKSSINIKTSGDGKLQERKAAINRRIDELKAQKRINDHEIIIRGQIPDYIRMQGKNYELPRGIELEGRVVRGAYTVPSSETADVEVAFKNIGKKYTRIPPTEKTISDAVTYVFDP